VPRRATITLYIDPRAYQDETGEKLTRQELEGIGRLVNEDMASLVGYESWEAKFVNGPDRRKRGDE
jgi:hypothetical protein